MRREAYLKRLVFLWRIRLTLFCLPLLILPLFINNFLFVAILVLFFFLETLILPIYLKKCKVALCFGYLKFEKGIIFKTCLIIPYDKIIYLNCFKTPLSKRLELTLPVIKAVGGTLFLPELFDDDIKKLKQYVEEATF